MNSVPNNDSKQCTESKLGWVHRVHTLNPSCAPQAVRKAPCRGARWGRPRRTFDRRCRACARGVAHVPGHVAPVSDRVAPVPGRVTAHTHELVRRVAILCCAQDRAVSQSFWPYHASPASYRGACSSVSQRCCTPCRSLSCDTPSSQAALLS